MSSVGVVMLLFLCVLLYFHSGDMNHRFDELEKRLPKPDPVAESTAETRLAAAAWDARKTAERAAAERNERNREVKRRAKERKVAIAIEQRKEKLAQIVGAVVASREYEQSLRNDKAAERGWPIHPNDMDWLDEAERKVMLQVFSERGPFRQEWLNPDV